MQAQLQAANTIEFQNLFRGLDSRMRRDYSQKYIEKFSSEQKERFRRNQLYSSTPQLWRRAKSPVHRMDERFREARSRSPDLESWNAALAR